MIARPWQAAVAGSGFLALSILLWPGERQVAEMQVRSGLVKDALPVFERAYREAPHDEALRQRLVDLYEAARRYGDALGLLEATGRDRPLTRAEREHGRRIGLAMGQPRRVLDLLTGPHEVLAVTEAPRLVDLALMAGDLPKARRLQETIVRAAPHDPEAVERLRDLSLASKDVRTAVAMQRMLYALHPTNAAAQQLVSLLLQAGRPIDALDVLEHAPPPAEREPWHQRAAQLAEWSRQPRRALPHVRALYALHPDRATGRHLLAVLVASRSPEAPALASRIAWGHPADWGLQREARSLLVGAGRTDEAIALLRIQIAQQPDDPTPHAEYVRLALGTSRLDEAIAELQRWDRLRPNDVGNTHQLAQALGWASRPEDAEAVYANLLAPGRHVLALAQEEAWREEWLKLSNPLDDVTPAMRTSLERLLAVRPGRIDLRRRLTAAQMEVGDHPHALGNARVLALDPGATPEDRARYAQWLVWDGRVAESTAYLAQLRPGKTYDPDLWRQAATMIERREAWSEAAKVLGLLLAAQPGRAELWEELAQVHEQQGDLLAAAHDWKRRLALGHASADSRLRAANLLERASGSQEAYEALVGAHSTLAEWRERARLALRLDRLADQETALAAILRLTPDDTASHLAIADLAERRGDHAAAWAHDEAALKSQDPDVVLQVAARRFYGPDPASATPLMKQVADIRHPSPRALRLMADFYQDRNPAKAATALDRLHGLGSESYDTWFRRGELAAALGDRPTAKGAWEKALDMAEPLDRNAAAAEVAAMSLERLGDRRADAAYDRLATRFSDQLSPTIAAARYRLRKGQPRTATALVLRAYRMAPHRVEVRSLQVDWLEASGRPAEAIPLLERLRQDQPQRADWASQEVQDLRAVGRDRLARKLARDEVDRHPEDPSWRDVVRGFETDGASQVEGFGWHETTSLLDHSAVGTRVRALVGDRLHLNVATSRLDWGTAANPAQEAELAISAHQGPFEGNATLAADNQTGPVRTPLGSLTLGWRAPTWRVQAEAQEARWEDSAATVAQQGRDRRLMGEIGWQPLSRLSLRGEVSTGWLYLFGGAVGQEQGYLTEASFRPTPDGPWSLSYQWQQRGWGAAGPLVGLPQVISVHSALVGYQQRFGAWLVGVLPGYSLDALSGASSPMVSGSLAWELSPDLAMSVAGAYSWRSLEFGGSGGYQRVDVEAHWRF